MGRDFTKIKAWRLADDLASQVYRATEQFPGSERYNLVQQMRRAAISVPANIAEGSARTSRKEYQQMLSIARGSLAELRYYLYFAKRLQCLDQERYQRWDTLRDEAARVLTGLMTANKNQDHL